ncbi:MAG: hypothetical protein JNK05_22750 [Myxococcales bacterium]|nr:hypothetical protein [Myxococcales bacterium]
MRSLRTALVVGSLSSIACSAPTQFEPEDATFSEAALVDRALVDRRSPATTTPYPSANVTVTLPFEGPEQTIDLDFTAAPGRVDVHLLVDTTASFDGEIRELQRALTATTLPALQRRVPSLTLGVSRFEDMPWEPFGFRTDRPFALIVPQTTDFGVVDRALFRLDDPLGQGGDLPESWYEALFQVATGRGLDLGAMGSIPRFSPGSVGGGALGGVGFRADAIRSVVLVTDAPSHDAVDYRGVIAGAHSGAQAVDALRALEIRVLGIASGPSARAALEPIAVQTGAVTSPTNGRCPTGLDGSLRLPTNGRCPLVFDITADGTGLSRTVADGIGALLDSIAYGAIHGEARDDNARFVRAIEAVSATPPANTTAPTREDRLPAGMTDGVADTFVTVRSGTVVRFRARLANRTVRESVFPQVFFLRVALVGDGMPLRETLVRVIVPEGPKFDAGEDDASNDGSRSDGAGIDADAGQPADASDGAPDDATADNPDAD